MEYVRKITPESTFASLGSVQVEGNGSSIPKEIRTD
jgi:hypothetical protein